MRDKPAHPEANGVWIATSKEHHESLRKDFPMMRSVYILSDGKSETDWQMIPLGVVGSVVPGVVGSVVPGVVGSVVPGVVGSVVPGVVGSVVPGVVGSV